MIKFKKHIERAFGDPVPIPISNALDQIEVSMNTLKSLMEESTPIENDLIDQDRI